MLSQLGAFALIITPFVFSLPSGPSINNIDSWIPVNYASSGDKPLPPVSSSWKESTAELFVGISHYRDNRCSATLNNLFSKAKYPDRLTVGIAQQIHTEKDNFHCVNDYCKQFTQRGEACKHRSQIRFIEFSHQNARGTSYARYMQQSLIKNEEFCMQVDAHSDVIQDWDVELTSMWGSIGNEYAVLSSAVPDVAVLRDRDLNGPDQQVPHLCQATFDSRGMIVNLPPTAAVHLSSPILAPLYSAGFSFSKCHAELKAPSDPNLQGIYDADEFAKYARLWTRGYDVYTPTKIVVAHDYGRTMSRVTGAQAESEAVDPLKWTSGGMTPQFMRDLYNSAVLRIATLLGFPEGDKTLKGLSLLTSYGLGNKRTLDQLIAFTGIDTRTKEVFGDRCKELEWVPFVPDADPYTADGDVWGLAPEMMAKGGPNIPLLDSGAVEVHPVSLFSESIASISRRMQAATEGDVPVAAVVEGDAQPLNLRAGKVLSPIVISLKTASDRIEAKDRIVDAFRHRGKELWWVFQSIDTGVESLMNHIDREVGMGHGHKVVKLILLALPVFVFVLGAALWVLVSGNSSRIFDSDHKRI